MEEEDETLRIEDDNTDEVSLIPLFISDFYFSTVIDSHHQFMEKIQFSIFRVPFSFQ